MIVTPFKTPPVRPQDDLKAIIKAALPQLKEKSVVVITSKIVALCQNRVVPTSQTDRDSLVPLEADYYLPREFNKYGFCLSVKNNTLIASAGIDESNGEGMYILWPEKLQQTVDDLREWLTDTYQLKEIGVIITDSHVLPLRWGTHGTALAHSGFAALNNYVGKPDIFGRPLKVTRANVAEGLASAAVVCMGEGNEQTPLAVIQEVPFVSFQKQNPTSEELAMLAISLEDDVFAPLLTAVPWVKGTNK